MVNNNKLIANDHGTWYILIYLLFIIDLLKIKYLIISETNDNIAMGVPKINKIQIKSVSSVIQKKIN